MENVVHADYLEKRSKIKFLSPWKKYWAVLEWSQLLFFRNKETHINRGQCLEKIDIKRVKYFDSDQSGNRIIIKSIDGNIFLRIKDSNTLKQWSQNLDKVIKEEYQNRNRRIYIPTSPLTDNNLQNNLIKESNKWENVTDELKWKLLKHHNARDELRMNQLINESRPERVSKSKSTELLMGTKDHPTDLTSLFEILKVTASDVNESSIVKVRSAPTLYLQATSKNDLPNILKEGILTGSPSISREDITKKMISKVNDKKEIEATTMQNQENCVSKKETKNGKTNTSPDANENKNYLTEVQQLQLSDEQAFEANGINITKEENQSGNPSKPKEKLNILERKITLKNTDENQSPKHNENYHVNIKESSFKKDQTIESSILSAASYSETEKCIVDKEEQIIEFMLRGNNKIEGIREGKITTVSEDGDKIKDNETSILNQTSDVINVPNKTGSPPFQRFKLPFRRVQIRKKNFQPPSEIQTRLPPEAIVTLRRRPKQQCQLQNGELLKRCDSLPVSNNKSDCFATSFSQKEEQPLKDKIDPSKRKKLIKTKSKTLDLGFSPPNATKPVQPEKNKNIRQNLFKILFWKSRKALTKSNRNSVEIEKAPDVSESVIVEALRLKKLSSAESSPLVVRRTNNDSAGRRNRRDSVRRKSRKYFGGTVRKKLRPRPPTLVGTDCDSSDSDLFDFLSDPTVVSRSNSSDKIKPKKELIKPSDIESENFAVEETAAKDPSRDGSEPLLNSIETKNTKYLDSELPPDIPPRKAPIKISNYIADELVKPPLFALQQAVRTTPPSLPPKARKFSLPVILSPEATNLNNDDESFASANYVTPKYLSLGVEKTDSVMGKTTLASFSASSEYDLKRSPTLPPKSNRTAKYRPLSIIHDSPQSPPALEYKYLKGFTDEKNKKIKTDLELDFVESQQNLAVSQSNQKLEIEVTNSDEPPPLPPKTRVRSKSPPDYSRPRWCEVELIEVEEEETHKFPNFFQRDSGLPEVTEDVMYALGLPECMTLSRKKKSVASKK